MTDIEQEGSFVLEDNTPLNVTFLSEFCPGMAVVMRHPSIDRLVHRHFCLYLF